MTLKDVDKLKDIISDTWVLDRIDELPVIEAEPIRHGRWEFIGGYGYQYRCSECITCAERKTQFCPNCGAKMDKK